ncbi:MAG: hypothetical protein KDE61_03060, partial [Novosphingobium sp.]|nr:hypothetical protein [Novosphingobium sp.]
MIGGAGLRAHQRAVDTGQFAQLRVDLIDARRRIETQLFTSLRQRRIGNVQRARQRAGALQRGGAQRTVERIALQSGQRRFEFDNRRINP